MTYDSSWTNLKRTISTDGGETYLRTSVTAVDSRYFGEACRIPRVADGHRCSLQLDSPCARFCLSAASAASSSLSDSRISHVATPRVLCYGVGNAARWNRGKRPLSS